MMSNIEHVAIIMDGNGRWASERGHPRFWGHIRGSQTASKIVEAAVRLKLKSLTLFAFSTENWRRPQQEIHVLFKLLSKYIRNEREKIIKNQIRFKVIGSIEKLPSSTQALIKELEMITASNQGPKLNFAFDYGGRLEILLAVNQFIKDHPGQSISENELSQNLLTEGIGDIDLLIRTSGEHRISNFLLWQLAYAELYFTPTKWPDFTDKDFEEICCEVAKRERRFGGVGKGV